ncbi:MAG: hypothetical protein PHU25_04905 [Deltaproteobacteria bacterium]|nr:hypothetical protein [Deltaproteobacteria bacterium]
MNQLVRRGFLVAMTLPLLVAGCSRGCGGEHGAGIGPSAAGPGPWKLFAIGSSQAQFVDAAKALAGGKAAPVEPAVSCGSQARLEVPDPERGIVEERPAGGHAVSNCAVQQASFPSQPSLRLVRGEFVDRALARVTFLFATEAEAGLRAELEKRLGEGGKRDLREPVGAGGGEREVMLWTRGDELWMLSRGSSGLAVVVRQDLRLSRALPAPLPPSVRGKPVSLDDIGIGRLDLKAPIPNVDGILVRDE